MSDEKPPRTSKKRNVVTNTSRTTKAEQEVVRQWLPIYEEYVDDRPKTRGDCKDGPRPCPWVSCKYNLYIDVRGTGQTAGKSIIFNFPDLEPHQVPPERSCALDIADEGGMTLDDVAKLTNLTRERVRQLQHIALTRLRRGKGEPLVQFVDDIDRKAKDVPIITDARSSLGKTKRAVDHFGEEEHDDDLRETDGDSVLFLSDHPRADDLITARMWRVYMRLSVQHGFAKRKRTKREIEELRHNYEHGNQEEDAEAEAEEEREEDRREGLGPDVSALQDGEEDRRRGHGSDGGDGSSPGQQGRREEDRDEPGDGGEAPT